MALSREPEQTNCRGVAKWTEGLERHKARGGPRRRTLVAISNLAL